MLNPLLHTSGNIYITQNEADSEPAALNSFSADHNDSLSNGLDHSESPAFMWHGRGITEKWIAWPTDLKGSPCHSPTWGHSGPSHCMRIQSMLISILFVAPFSDGSSTKFKSMGWTEQMGLPQGKTKVC